MTIKKFVYIILATVALFGAYIAPLSVAKAPEAGIPIGSLKAVSELPASVLEPKQELDIVPITPVQYVQLEAKKYGWDKGSEWAALQRLVSNESGWRVDAMNSSSGACGLFQALPCSKVRGDWRSPKDSATFGLGYIKNRYGSPSRALSFWYAQSPHWY